MTVKMIITGMEVRRVECFCCFLNVCCNYFLLFFLFVSFLSFVSFVYFFVCIVSFLVSPKTPKQKSALPNIIFYPTLRIIYQESLGKKNVAEMEA